jgi:hypothetical protein
MVIHITSEEGGQAVGVNCQLLAPPPTCAIRPKEQVAYIRSSDDLQTRLSRARSVCSAKFVSATVRHSEIKAQQYSGYQAAAGSDRKPRRQLCEQYTPGIRPIHSPIAIMLRPVCTVCTQSGGYCPCLASRALCMHGPYQSSVPRNLKLTSAPSLRQPIPFCSSYVHDGYCPI